MKLENKNENCAASELPPSPTITDQTAGGGTTATAKDNKKSPSDFLKSVLGRPVSVRLNSGTDYRGVLACLDGYMNIAMEQTEEYDNGQLKARYGDCFIRGNNG
uniref:Sm domain-containing protein n=1 Tax=Corethron hystrix TaxID=216773 RepID=A0A7S1BIP9_9STRA|mmetsp:Transcript_28139/g.64391  ORF Transcript_28139/g.64391 Transcript_28139/m.64391 type:complete len:104 (+) Transcript_28139:116-427(+)